MRHDDRVAAAAGSAWQRPLGLSRAGPVFGLLFLIGPVAQLAQDSDSTAQNVAIAVALAGFVALYLALLPPAAAIERRGPLAIRGGIGLLAAIAGLTLLLGAPRSFALLFAYVVATAGLLLPAAAAAAVIAGITAAVGAGLAASGADGSDVAAYVLSILGVGMVMWALAREARANRKLRAAREELARLVVTEERLRIARDLHDLLGHTLSVIVLKSELAARLVEREPRRAAAEMEDVQRVTRQALTEVRDAVQGYRRLPFADALDGARAALAAAGIDCRVQGSAAHLPAEVEDLLAWTVREAATNVVRHSGARACAITYSSDDDGVALQVEDDGTAAAPGSGDGAGLAGLAERARRLDGRLEAGARPEGGFRLRLAVPFPAS
jgi:two-component system, NarL family, sensor histidine kinase DesK